MIGNGLPLNSCCFNETCMKALVPLLCLGWHPYKIATCAMYF